MPNLEQLQQDHDAIAEMLTNDRAADTITDGDAEVYTNLITENREGFKQIVVESKNSGPVEVPVTKKIANKALERAFDPTYQQAFEDSWHSNNR